MKTNEEQASSLALIKILQEVNLSSSELESTVIALLQHLYPNDVNKVLLFIEQMDKAKN